MAGAGGVAPLAGAAAVGAAATAVLHRRPAGMPASACGLPTALHRGLWPLLKIRWDRRALPPSCCHAIVSTSTPPAHTPSSAAPFAGMKLANLSKILKCAGNDDAITMKSEDNGDHITFMFEAPSE